MNTLSKILQRYAKLCVKSLVVIAILSCGGGYYYVESELYFFTPEVAKEVKFEPFYRTFNKLYEYDKMDNLDDFNQINSAEWQTYLGQNVRTEDISFLLYTATDEEIERWSKGNAEKHEVQWTANSIQNAPKEKKREFMLFLHAARTCNKLLNKYYWWDEEIEKSRGQLDILLRTKPYNVKSVKDDFVKQRYHFITLRILFELERYEECEIFYKDEMASLKKNASESIDWRARSYVAGAIKRQKREAEGNYLFSRIYDEYEPMWHTAMMSFSIASDTVLQETIALAKSNREKEVIWHMFGIENDEVRAISEIYLLNPQSEFIDVLLTRWVNKREEQILWQENEIEDPYYSEEIDPNYSNETDDSWLYIIADHGHTRNPAIWYLSAGYMMMHKGNFDKMDQYYQLALSHSSDQLLKDEVRLFRLLGRILQQQKPDAEFESYVVNELEWMRGINESPLRTSGALVWVHRKLNALYDRDGMTCKGECLFTDVDSFYSSVENLDMMIAFMERKDHTPMEKYAQKYYTVDLRGLYELKGILAFYDNNLPLAKEYFVRSNQNDKMRGDPFTIHVKDCHDCDHYDEAALTYSKTGFIEAMMWLEEDSKKNPGNAAKNYFFIANGYYNATYYGNHRQFYYNPVLWTYYGSVYDSGEYYTERYENKTLFLDILGMDRAVEYYTKAREASGDKEFKAKCTFMLAKCEQNDFFTTGKTDFPCPENLQCDFVAGKYFRELKSDYSTTTFYNEELPECGYFQTFLARP